MEKLEVSGAVKYDPLEISRIIGQPLDDRRPYSGIVESVCETDFAGVNEYVYYYTAVRGSELIYTITTTGALTSSNVTLNQPTLFDFVDVATPEYYIKYTDLAKAKENVLARTNVTINRALNQYEDYYILKLADAAATSSSHTHTLQSGRTRFSYDDLILMLEDVIDYGDSYTLLVGPTVDRDIKLWDWNDNKYSSMLQAFKDLGLDKIRITTNWFALDGTSKNACDPRCAYIVAKDTQVGRPFLFVRKQINDMETLGGTIMKVQGDKPQRIAIVSPNPVNASGGTTRYLAVGVTGWEEIVAACTNTYAISKFTRS